jgi:hypothetical protein
MRRVLVALPIVALILGLTLLPILTCHACDGTGNINILLPPKLRTTDPPACKNCRGNRRVTPFNRAFFELNLWWSCRH